MLIAPPFLSFVRTIILAEQRIRRKQWTWQPCVLGLVNHAHPTPAQLVDDAVVRKGLSNHGVQLLKKPNWKVRVANTTFQQGHGKATSKERVTKSLCKQLKIQVQKISGCSAICPRMSTLTFSSKPRRDCCLGELRLPVARVLHSEGTIRLVQGLLFVFSGCKRGANGRSRPGLLPRGS